MRKASADRLDYDCKTCKRETDTIWRKANVEKKSASNKAYREANKEKLKAYFTEHARTKRRSDSTVRLKHNLRRRLNKAIRGIAKSKSTLEMLGAPIEHVRSHLESKFQPGMTWENYGQWHVDHVVPLALAKTSQEMEALFHYTNLQPLWALDNIRKSDNYQGNQ